MVIVYCAERNLYPVLPTAINSLISNNDVDKIYLLIEDDSIEYINHPSIKFINCNQFDFLIRDGFNCSRRFPYMAMTRCFLTKILNEDRIIYLDCDTIVDTDITELWELDLGDNLIAARFENEKYFNSGVLLMDLGRIRKLKYDDKVINLLNRCNLVFPDQDALNIIFRPRMVRLDHKFNAMGNAIADKVYETEIAIRHYPGVTKPWKPNANSQDIAFWNKYKTDKIDYQCGVK